MKQLQQIPVHSLKFEEYGELIHLENKYSNKKFDPTQKIEW